MNHLIRLNMIPAEKYSDYRYDVIFKAYKWDPQVGDHNTVARHVIQMDRQTADKLGTWAEQLSEETMLMEESLISKTSLAKELGLPTDIFRSLGMLSGYKRNRNIRLMRFDFHPTESGWAVSEVNSDVPGGLAEASVLPEIACKYFEGHEPGDNVAEVLLDAFRTRLKSNSTIAFVHATSYSDDRQVMQFLSDYFTKNGFNSVFAAPDHLKWINKRAVSIVKGSEGDIDGIIRFFPLEWLVSLPRKADWKGYYDCETPSCNHPVSIFAQSKRLPLIWDRLGVSVPAWKHLLPKTVQPVKNLGTGWIYKPALGRVGEGVSIKEAISVKELRQIERAVSKNPKDWVAQERFLSQPIKTSDGQSYHVCIGVFTVDGKRAGFYGRISPYPRIDANAVDIPILVSKDGMRDV